MLSEAFELCKRGDIFIHALIAKAMILWHEEQHAQIIKVLGENINECEKSSNKYFKANYLALLALANKNVGNLEIAKELFENVRMLYKELGNNQELAYLKNNLANLEFVRKKFDLAEKHAQNSLELGKLIDNPIHIGNVWDTLARISIEKKEFDTAIERAEKAIGILSKTESGHKYEAKRSFIKALYHSGKTKKALKVYAQTRAELAIFSSEKVAKCLDKMVNNLVQNKNMPELVIEAKSERGFTSFEAEVPMSIDPNLAQALLIKHNRLSTLDIHPDDILIIENTSEFEDLTNKDFVVVTDIDKKQAIGELTIVYDCVSIKDGNGIIRTMEKAEIKSYQRVLGTCRFKDGFEFKPIKDIFSVNMVINDDFVQ